MACSHFRQRSTSIKANPAKTKEEFTVCWRVGGGAFDWKLSLTCFFSYSSLASHVDQFEMVWVEFTTDCRSKGHLTLKLTGGTVVIATMTFIGSSVNSLQSNSAFFFTPGCFPDTGAFGVFLCCRIEMNTLKTLRRERLAWSAWWLAHGSQWAASAGVIKAILQVCYDMMIPNQSPLSAEACTSYHTRLRFLDATVPLVLYYIYIYIQYMLLIREANNKWFLKFVFFCFLSHSKDIKNKQS